MGTIKKFEDLEIWQIGRKLNKEIIELTKKLIETEKNLIEC
jgi:hypothetical protein